MRYSTIYFLLILLSLNACNVKDVTVQEITPVNEVEVKNRTKKSPIDSAQVIKINNNNRKRSIINPTKSKGKKGL
tara:strand:- start:2227 stop:2451 length:225 start_codon:yes stop_codon:yes gene_type:complete